MDWPVVISLGAVLISVFGLVLRFGEKYPSIREHQDLKDRVNRLEDLTLPHP